MAKLFIKTKLCSDDYVGYITNSDDSVLYGFSEYKTGRKDDFILRPTSWSEDGECLTSSNNGKDIDFPLIMSEVWRIQAYSYHAARMCDTMFRIQNLQNDGESVGEASSLLLFLEEEFKHWNFAGQFINGHVRIGHIQDLTKQQRKAATY